MAYFKTCEYCGDNLDPGERCDCNKREPLKPTKVKRAQYKYITRQYDLSKVTFQIKYTGEVVVL